MSDQPGSERRRLRGDGGQPSGDPAGDEPPEHYRIGQAPYFDPSLDPEPPAHLLAQAHTPTEIAEARWEWHAICGQKRWRAARDAWEARSKKP